MRLQSLVSGMARRRSGVALLIGVSSVLTGVSRLLKRKLPQQQNRPVPALPRTGVHAESRRHYFSIRQTRSEVGFVYWVLQGFGCFESFSLHDTWREAVDEANRRLADCPVAVAAELALLQQG